jgi:RNA polymerase sigma-70 factor (ECF subfamily)
VPLADQDTRVWDHAMIVEAEAFLRQASRFRRHGRYQLEAAVQSAHVERRLHGTDNRAAVLRLYDAIATLCDSPVVAINRSLAMADVHGAEAALAALPVANPENGLLNYQPYWAARAELLARTGAHREARQAYDLAIGLASDEAVRRFLQERRAAIALSD